MKQRNEYEKRFIWSFFMHHIAIKDEIANSSSVCDASWQPKKWTFAYLTGASTFSQNVWSYARRRFIFLPWMNVLPSRFDWGALMKRIFFGGDHNWIILTMLHLYLFQSRSYIGLRQIESSLERLIRFSMRSDERFHFNVPILIRMSSPRYTFRMIDHILTGD